MAAFATWIASHWNLALAALLVATVLFGERLLPVLSRAWAAVRSFKIGGSTVKTDEPKEEIDPAKIAEAQDAAEFAALRVLRLRFERNNCKDGIAAMDVATAHFFHRDGV